MNHTELTRRTLHELTSLEAHLDAHEFSRDQLEQKPREKRSVGRNIATGVGVLAALGIGQAGVKGALDVGEHYSPDFKRGYSRARAADGSWGKSVRRGLRGASRHAGADARNIVRRSRELAGLFKKGFADGRAERLALKLATRGKA